MKSVIYRVLDGKIGHERQSEGLALALSQLSGAKIETMPAMSFMDGIRLLFSRKHFSSGNILIGAGHKTHLTLLLYRFKYQVKTVVIMKPSWPCCFFSFCIVPYHDGLLTQKNVICTEGAMNSLSLNQSIVHKVNRILILVGGESPHCSWQNAPIYAQIAIFLAAAGDSPVVLTTSRRTPVSFITDMPESIVQHISIIPYSETEEDWLKDMLLSTSEVWATSESVSMVYEALSAGCIVRLLNVPELRGKIAHNIERLYQQGYITDGIANMNAIEPLNESRRVAEHLLERGLVCYDQSNA